MDNLAHDSSLRILFLLNLLYGGELSKDEIIEEFKKNGVRLRKTSVNNYINKLKNNDIPVSVKKIKNKNFYSLEKKYHITPVVSEINSTEDVKKLIKEQKNPDIIRKSMRVFYKSALFAPDTDTIAELINFGYFSKINLALVKQLKKHCENKDIIALDYILPTGENKNLIFHADTLKLSDRSDRLYLCGILQYDNKISRLPVDKIFMIKKVVKERVRISLETKVLTYKISKKMFLKSGLDKNEGLGEIKNKVVTVKRPLDDTFFTLQRLLSFCPDLYYISDEKIKELVKEKLYTLKDIYNEQSEE